LVLDATVKGGEARFINHSCDANCYTQKWQVRGELRVGIFSKALIAKGTEITYDYNLEWNGHARVPCVLLLLFAVTSGWRDLQHVCA
jgi:SET domain-containing protein